MSRLKFYLLLFFVAIVFVNAQAQVFTLSNSKVIYKLIVDSGSVIGDSLLVRSGWARQFGVPAAVFTSDAEFSMQIFWTDWSAPGKVMNADNELVLSSEDFKLVDVKKQNNRGVEQLDLLFKGPSSIRLRLTYQLPADAFYIRRRITVYDTLTSKHYLQVLAPLDISFSAYQVCDVKNSGGFGQPVALTLNSGGIFFGLEYPAATQDFIMDQNWCYVKARQEVGKIIDKNGISSDWAVLGITPDKNVKWWFYQYLNSQRISPLKPYTLYNTWYDLRSPDYPGVTPDHVMNERNVLKIIDLFKKNMIDKYGIKLDAFVLDDGWDNYQSAWELNRQTFPHGLKPVSDKLQQMGTVLGIWLSPCGGYSFRNKRINYMRLHGYEVTGKPVNWWNQQLCLAGKHYSALFKRRITDFVKKDRVGFFKWDGIQFSCSDPSHGHPVGVYSRRAIMDTVISMVKAVRGLNPNVFLNITSGTWLSPWWVKYANTVWMQGEDYGYAHVPSISKRDAAMTYRDFILYEDFVKNNFWFPIANLMTHGIIKGKLQELGDTSEPFDKFTNNVVWYFARGVTMYELYISPDILTDAQWQALSQALKWAKANFDVLKNSFFIGGNPQKRQAYGYIHFSGRKGILALRNPFIDSTHISVQLSPAYGLNANAQNLVIEQVYPYHQVLPRMFKAGDLVTFTLKGYETAIFEIYPIDQAMYPLISGAKFNIEKISDNQLIYRLFDINNPELLNPKTVTKIADKNGKRLKLQNLSLNYNKLIETQFYPLDSSINFFFNDPNAMNVKIAVLFENQDTTKLPKLTMIVNNEAIQAQTQSYKNRWIWLTYTVKSNKINGNLYIKGKYNGSIRVYAIFDEQVPEAQIFIKTRKPVSTKIYPPQIYKPATLHKIIEIGEF